MRALHGRRGGCKVRAGSLARPHRRWPPPDAPVAVGDRAAGSTAHVGARVGLQRGVYMQRGGADSLVQVSRTSQWAAMHAPGGV